MQLDSDWIGMVHKEATGTQGTAHPDDPTEIELGFQLIAFFTSVAIFASSAAVSSFKAKAVGHM
jgi:hypothetical protein